MVAVAQVYTDGGVIKVNPSPFGGTWAYRLIGPDGLLVDAESYYLTPGEVGLPTVSNNVMELYAALRGLEACEGGWSGELLTDSNVTLLRVRRQGAKMNGIPQWMIKRLLAVKERLGDYWITLLGGHPSKLDLRRGHRSDGMPVHWQNHLCDLACTAEAEQFLKERTVAT